VKTQVEYQAELKGVFYGGDKYRVDDYKVIFAVEDDECYSGSLYAILKKGRLWFEYGDSHCSCNGYEFNPQPVTKTYLNKRFVAGATLPYPLSPEDGETIRALLGIK
jgi:hypothetical protein